MNKPLKSTDLQDGIELSDKITLLAKRHKTPLNPKTFEIWYLYLVGDDLQLRKDVDAIIKANTTIDQYEFHQLLEGKNDDGSKLLEENKTACKDLQSGLNSVLGLIKSHMNSNDEFSKSLDKNIDILNSESSPDELVKTIGALIANGAEMQNSSKMLQDELDGYKEQLKNTKVRLKKSIENEMKDALTLMPNRRFFDQTLNEEISLSRSENIPLCLAMVDIDNFKILNDTFGHLIGDDVLKFIASLMMKSIKGQDTAARYGGEEFAIILPNTRIEDAAKLIEKIRSSIESSKLVLSKRQQSIGQVTASFGIAQLGEADDPESLIHNADKNLYKAKSSGKNKVVH